MSEKIRVGLAYKPFDYATDGQRDFDDEYVITVARSDGRGLTHVEAETVLSVYLMTVKTSPQK